METKRFSGFVTADIIDVRFAFSGKVVAVGGQKGQTVKKWESIASLDRKILQAELDRQLADYEKKRAEFELFRLKHGEGGDDTIKFLRQQVQATLNASVKEVELAKFKLDQASLYSPVNGVIADLGELVPGLYITPSSNPVKIINSESFALSFSIQQKQLSVFQTPQKVRVDIESVEKKYDGNTVAPIMGKNGMFDVAVPLIATPDILMGMKGTVILSV